MEIYQSIPVIGIDKDYIYAGFWVDAPKFLEDHKKVLTNLGYTGPHEFGSSLSSWIKFFSKGYPVRLETQNITVQVPGSDSNLPCFKPVTIEGFENHVLKAITEINPNYQQNHEAMQPLRDMMGGPPRIFRKVPCDTKGARTSLQ